MVIGTTMMKALLNTLHIFELAAPDQLVARRECEVLLDRFLGIGDITSDVAFRGIKINGHIAGKSSVFITDHGGPGYQRDVGQLSQGNVSPSRGTGGC